MRVLNLCTQDIAGIGHRTAEAFARHAPGWAFDHVALHENWLAYPAGRPPREAADLAAAADVVHLHQSFKLARRYGIAQPTVITHHGSKFRAHRDTLLAEQRRRGAVGLATTLGPWLLAPDDLEYAPPCYDLDALASHRQPIDDGVLRIGHAPTSRAKKNTEALIAAVDKLSRDLPVELVLIEGKPWAECLAIKGTVDILFDGLQRGHGCNAIEAWGMGIPVIAGADDPAVLEEMQDRFGSLPFYATDEGKIYDALVALADAAARAHWSRRGLDHVNQWHDDRRVVDQLQRVYRRAVEH